MWICVGDWQPFIQLSFESTIAKVALFPVWDCSTGDIFQSQFSTISFHEFHVIKCQISSTKRKQPNIIVSNLETFFLNIFINTSVFLQAFIFFLNLVWEPSDQIWVQEHMWCLSEHWRQHRLKPCNFWGGDWTAILWGECPCFIITVFS